MPKLWILLLGLMLTGCGAPYRQILPEDRYVPPAESDHPAYFLGSYSSRGFKGEATAYVRAVEDKQVTDPRRKWNEPLPVLPGRRKVTLAFKHWGMFMVEDVTIDLRPGLTYQVRFKDDLSVLRRNECDLWVVETETGNRVTDVFHFVAMPVDVPVTIPIP